VCVLATDPADSPRELRERVGIVLQQTGVQGDLTVAELVEMYGRYYVRRRPVDELIDLVGLAEKRNVQAKKLSGGQRRRLDLSAAMQKLDARNRGEAVRVAAGPGVAVTGASSGCRCANGQLRDGRASPLY
jgi:ABC-type Na+ transport system ATPase subunit NatA